MLGRLGVVVGAVALCFASASQSEYRPVRARAPASVTDADIYSAAIRVFNERGLVIETKDETAATVATEWITAYSMGETKLLHRWRAVATDGELALYIDCRRIAGSAGAESCNDSAKREDAFQSEAPPLHRAILDEAIRIQQRRPGPR